MANKAISELPQAQNVNNQDLFVLEQSGIAKKLPAETFITEQGIINALAEALDGHGGIQSVTLSSVSGRIRTYRITFTDQSATTFQVYDGTSIDRISRTSSSGLDDVYTIFLSDGTTTFFTVHNGADGTVSEAMLNDALKDKAPAITETTESSAIATFADGADDMVMHNVVAEINPVQDLTYGDPYPAGGGVNQWDEEWEVGSFDPSTGLPVSASGTIRSKNFCPCVGGASYYVKCANYTDIYALCVYWYDADKTFISRLWTCAQTATAPTSARYFKIVTNSSGTVYGTTYNHDISINYPATVTAYSPYSNICPITGWTGCNVTRTGKNLADFTNGYGIGQNGLPSEYAKRSSTVTPIVIKSGCTYKGICTGTNVFLIYSVFDASDTLVRRVTAVTSGTTLNTDGGAYLYVCGYDSADVNTITAEANQLMVIEGSGTDTTYEPYTATTVSLSWQTEAGTVYGGTIDVATGLLTVGRAYKAYNGAPDESWHYESTTQGGNFYIYVGGASLPQHAGNSSMICNMLPVSPVNGAWKDTCYISNGRNLNVTVGDTLGIDNVADWKTYLASNNFAIAYELATPQTYQLTPQEVKTLLGTNNVWADTGDTTVTYVADTKMFIEKLTMPTEDDLVANQAITSGKYFMVGNSLYLALANIASGAQITIGTNAQRVSLADALNTINS